MDSDVPYTSYVDVLLLLVRDGHVLLVQRFDTGYADGDWNAPSVHLASRLSDERCRLGRRATRDAIRGSSFGQARL